MTPPITNIGTPLQAIMYALSLDDTTLAIDFLRDWSDGDVDEWDQYCLHLSIGKLDA